MASHELVLQLDDAALEWLDTERKRTGQTREKLAETLIEEGLRMQAHPGIMFRSGPAGRRAALAAGPDIWEIATAVIGLKRDDCFSVERIAELASISVECARIALDYYAAYQDEIDTEIRRRDEVSAVRQEVWLREQALIQA